eukprot:Blabericola_migrator_1__13085@NODE_889_length_6163_cov_243_088911_g626_i0_p1_GENE_NODE_889_length_6163_cov_243_088911_g626_i0NODE_889_length_6163_cov_243_088911_g626_i0_p1_ORF_typecomplete_len492_score120_49DSHCT/PF08148_12/1_5e43Pyr_excise/PF03013_14/8_7e02Pyr_excise/PF03013_14/0_31_NODE_889_length_6163_cov_243_088911_g626_i04751950
MRQQWNRQAFQQPDQMTMVSEVQNPTLTCLVLIPRGAKFYEEKDINALPALESRHLLNLLTRGSHGDVKQIKPQVLYRGQLLAEDAETVQEALDMDIKAALELGQGHYAPSREFVVAKQIALECVGSLINEVVSPGAGAWQLTEASSPSDIGDRGGLPEMDDSNDDFPSLGGSPKKVALKDAMRAEYEAPEPIVDTSANDQLQWHRLAHTLSDLLVRHGSMMKTFVLPRKMRLLETDHVLEMAELQDLTEKLIQNKCHFCPKRDINMQLEIQRRELLKDIDDLRYTISDSSLDLVPDMMAKIDVLKTFNFINANGSIALKGRAACEVVATDEITLIEALFNDVFNDKPPEVVASIVSAFVFPDSNDDEEVIFNEEVDQARQEIEAIHDHVADELMKRGVHVDREDWQRLCSFKFAHVAYRWASGEPFTKLTERTSLQEGTIVRTIVRLDELIKKLRTVAHAIGNMKLKEVFQEASNKIHRDIVFATSLYVQ